jgi:hypothetical protein
MNLLRYVWKIFLFLLAWLLLTAGALCLIEGLCSFLFIFIAQNRGQTALAEEIYTDFNPQLGWSNKPSRVFKNLFGPNKTVTTDNFGFRVSPTSRERMNAKNRILCLGDSFTFGYGVDDTETWCNLLQADPDIGTVNMGVGGYGIDQAFLRYKLNQDKLDHNLILFAPIAGDFRRALAKTEFGVEKPVLSYEDEILSVTNVPLSPPTSMARALQRYGPLLSRLRIVTGLQRVRGGGASELQPSEVSALTDLTRGIVLELERIAAQHHAHVLYALLPAEDDYAGTQWKIPASIFEQLAVSQKIDFVNLVRDFWATHPQQSTEYFIHDSKFYAGNGHYSPSGNRFIAEKLAQRLEPHLQR